MLQQNNENREICKLSKESHKYLVNKGKNADSSNNHYRNIFFTLNVHNNDNDLIIEWYNNSPVYR